MKLQSRDFELFKLLSRYAMLSSRQINYLLFNSIAKTTVLKRLRSLENKNYIARLRGLESQDVLWVLQEKGADVASVPLPKRHYSKNLLEHDYELLTLRLVLEGAVLAHSWLAEHEIRQSIFKNNDFRSAKEKLIPDGLMGIEVHGIKQTLAVELELTLKNKDKLKKVIGRYKEKNAFGVWYVSPSKSILNSVFHLWKNTGSMNKNEPYIYLSFLDELMKSPSDAKIYGDGDGKKISALWTLNAIRPAHSTAQSVSKFD